MVSKLVGRTLVSVRVWLFIVNVNANLKLFLSLSNCASVGEKTLTDTPALSWRQMDTDTYISIVGIEPRTTVRCVSPWRPDYSDS